MEANYFTVLHWFCHTSTWICHGCTRVPHPEPPSYLPPHGFSVNSIMSSASRDNFTSSFSVWIPFISFLFQLLWLGLLILCWIKVGRVGILVLFLILEEMLSAFHCWVSCYLWVCHIWHLLCWNMFPLCPTFWRVFIINDIWSYQKLFLHQLRWSYCFYFSIC